MVPSKLMLLNSYLDLWRSGEPGAVVVWTTFLKLFELFPVSACLLPPAPSLVDWFVDLFKELIVDTKIIFSNNNSLSLSLSHLSQYSIFDKFFWNWRISSGEGGQYTHVSWFLIQKKNLNSTFRIFLVVHSKKKKKRKIQIFKDDGFFSTISNSLIHFVISRINIYIFIVTKVVFLLLNYFFPFEK